MIAGLSIIICLLNTSDPWSRAIGEAVSWLIFIPLIALILPALLLGVMGRLLPFAFLLSAGAVPATLFLLHHG
jgi:hypothetical protein